MGGFMEDAARAEAEERAVVNAAAKLGKALHDTRDMIFCPVCDPDALDLANEHLQDFGFRLVQLPSKTLRERILAAVKESVDGLRLPALVAMISASYASPKEKRAVERAAKHITLTLIDDGTLTVDNEYRVKRG